MVSGSAGGRYDCRQRGDLPGFITGSSHASRGPTDRTAPAPHLPVAPIDVTAAALAGP